MSGNWSIKSYIFSGYHRLNIRDYVYKRVSKPGYGFRITHYNLRNASNEAIYVGNVTHTCAIDLMAKGCCLPTGMDLHINNQDIITLFSGVLRVAKADIAIGYELVPMNLEGLGETLAKVEWNPDDLRGKPVFPCSCDFYEVILKSGCQCGGT